MFDNVNENEEPDHEDVLATGLEDLIVPFMGITPMMGAHYALCYDPHILCSLGDALRMFASEIVSFSANQILQQTILATVMSALNWPMWLVKLGYLVDNPWSLGLDRSRKAGLILADSICNNVQSGRPVTLIGFSLGAKVIFHCLVELASRGKFGIIEDVYLFGAPILTPRVLPPRPSSSTSDRGSTKSAKDKDTDDTAPQFLKSLDEWRMAVSVVGGRMVNCFSRNDWVLGYLFRASVAGMWDVAGLNPVILDEEETPDVEVVPLDELAPTEKPEDPEQVAYKTLAEEDREKKLRDNPYIVHNYDITELVPGHMFYRDAMPSLIKRICKFACWTEQVDVIEEVFHLMVFNKFLRY